VIAAVPWWNDAPDLRAVAMPGGITNHNFRVDVGGESFVVRLAGTDTEVLGIDRDAERAAAEAAAGAGVGPEVVAYLPEHGSLITRFLEAEPIPEDWMSEEPYLSRIVEAISRFHAVGPIPGAFDPFRVVEAYRKEADERGVPIPVAYDRAALRAERIELAFASVPLEPRPCHNDLLNANFLLAGDRVMIVDYEYAGMGNPYFDLANFCVNNGLGPEAQERMLDHYFGEVTRAHRGRLCLMRIVSDFREAMWGVVQQGLSTLDFDYVGYTERHLDRCLANAADPRFEEWVVAAAQRA
jgi:thiamine kinase-like enzyme